MLDLKFVREHQEEVEQALKNRGQEISLDEYRGREAERRQLLTRLEELRHERNTLSKEVGALMQAGKRDEAQPLRDRVTAINEESKNLEAQTEAQDSWVRDFLLNLPNLPHESVPMGASSRRQPGGAHLGRGPPVRLSPQGPLGHRGEPGHPGFRTGRQDHRGPLRPAQGGRGLAGAGPHQLYAGPAHQEARLYGSAAAVYRQ